MSSINSNRVILSETVLVLSTEKARLGTTYAVDVTISESSPQGLKLKAENNQLTLEVNGFTTGHAMSAFWEVPANGGALTVRAQANRVADFGNGQGNMYEVNIVVTTPN